MLASESLTLILKVGVKVLRSAAANAVHKAETIDHFKVLSSVTEIPSNDFAKAVYIDDRLGDVIARADL